MHKTLADHLHKVLLDNIDKKVEFTYTGSFWCEDHEGARIMRILVNGEMYDAFCPYSYE